MVSDHTTIFKSAWDSYQWTLDNDVMGHSKILPKVRLLIESVTQGQRIKMLDLGCGNAAPAVELITNMKMAHYYGVDLAGNVLLEAEALMNHLSIPARLFERDLFEGIPESLSVNLIYSAFAIHHGQQEQKGKLFETLYHQADKGCYFCLVDIVRYPSQSRESCIDMMSEYLARRIPQPVWQKQVLDHVRDYDYPEKPDNLRAFAREAGWQCIEDLQLEIDAQYPVGVFLFKK